MGEICFNAHDHRNGALWTISRMVGNMSVPWLKIRPFRMTRPSMNDPIAIELTVDEYNGISWAEICRNTHQEGEIIRVLTSDAIIRIIFSNCNMNLGTMDINCCYDTVDKCNLNVSVYDEKKQPVEGAGITYAGQSKTTGHTGFASFLVSCDTVGDVHIDLPPDYSCGAPYSPCDFADVAVDEDNDPSTPHVLYVQVKHSPPVPEGVTLAVPSLAMAGEIELAGTCDIIGLEVSIYAVRKWLGFDWAASDTLVATAIVGDDRRFKTSVTFDEFGCVELYARVSETLQSEKSSMWVLTPVIVAALLISAGLIIEKKYNMLGLFKGGKK